MMETEAKVRRPFMTVTEVAHLFKVHRNTVYNWIRSGQISAFKVGRDWHIETASLGRFPCPSE